MVRTALAPESATTKLQSHSDIANVPDAPEVGILHDAGEQRLGVFPWNHFGQLLAEVHETDACCIVSDGPRRPRNVVWRTPTCQKCMTGGGSAQRLAVRRARHDPKCCQRQRKLLPKDDAHVPNCRNAPLDALYICSSLRQSTYVPTFQHRQDPWVGR